MERQTGTIWRAAALLLASVVVGSAQVNSSQAPQTPPAAAGPGSINYVEGQAALDGQPLTRDAVGSAALKPGEMLTTGDGYVEVLLTPGAFLRVGRDSEVQLPTAGLAGADVQLGRGAAMLEVDQLIRGTTLTVTVAGTTARVEKNGLYSFNASAPSMQTFDGKLKVVRGTETVGLGKHDQLLLAGDQPFKKQHFNDDGAKGQPLYVWSKARSADLAQASYTAASNAQAYAAAGTGWFWDPYFAGYGFWPPVGALYSPFGWGFYSPAYFGYARPAWGYHQYRWGRVGGTAGRIAAPGARAPRVQNFRAPAIQRAPMPRMSAPMGARGGRR